MSANNFISTNINGTLNVKNYAGGILYPAAAGNVNVDGTLTTNSITTQTINSLAAGEDATLSNVININGYIKAQNFRSTSFVVGDPAGNQLDILQLNQGTTYQNSTNSKPHVFSNPLKANLGFTASDIQEITDPNYASNVTLYTNASTPITLGNSAAALTINSPVTFTNSVNLSQINTAVVTDSITPKSNQFVTFNPLPSLSLPSSYTKLGIDSSGNSWISSNNDSIHFRADNDTFDYATISYSKSLFNTPVLFNATVTTPSLIANLGFTTSNIQAITDVNYASDVTLYTNNTRPITLGNSAALLTINSPVTFTNGYYTDSIHFKTGAGGTDYAIISNSGTTFNTPVTFNAPVTLTSTSGNYPLSSTFTLPPTNYIGNTFNYTDRRQFPTYGGLISNIEPGVQEYADANLLHLPAGVYLCHFNVLLPISWLTEANYVISLGLSGDPGAWVWPNNLICYGTQAYSGFSTTTDTRTTYLYSLKSLQNVSFTYSCVFNSSYWSSFSSVHFYWCSNQKFNIVASNSPIPSYNMYQHYTRIA